MHYVGVDSPEIAKARIAHRVSRGGHGIPDSDVERRYVESLQNINVVLPWCDMAILYDNSEAFHRFAWFIDGELEELFDDEPKWFRELGILPVKG